MPGYATTSVNPNNNSPNLTDPDVPMFELSNEELRPPSSFHSPTRIDSDHCDSNDDYNDITDDKTDSNCNESAGGDFSDKSDGDSDNDGGNTQDGYDGDDDDDPVELEDDSSNQLLETIFHCSSQPAAAAVDLDAEHEASDEEEESQLQSVSWPSGAQAGRYLYSGRLLSLMRFRGTR